MEALPMDNQVLSLKEGETLHLSIAPDADAAEVLDQLQRGIYIDVLQLKGNHVKLGVEATISVSVLRSELIGK